MSDPRDDDAVLREARRRVEGNKTDLALRFALGRVLAERRRAKEAVAELQKARQNPRRRREAMRLLRECYETLGMAELAEDTRRQIEAEDWREEEPRDEERPGDEEGPGGAASPAPLRPVKPGSPGAEKAWPTGEG